MKNTQRQPSELLQEFLNYIDQVKSEYEMAREAVGKKEKKTRGCRTFYTNWSLQKIRLKEIKSPRSSSEADKSEDDKRTRYNG